MFHSTINKTPHVDFITAMQAGLAADGGLFVPDYFPSIALEQFPTSLSYSQFASQLLRYFIDEPLQAELDLLCQQAFNFDIPLKQLNPNTWVLELFHGPTLSFKDFGARFIAACLQRVPTEKPITILVATSGDTGSAVAAAFYQKHPIRVIVLYPKGKISLRQQQQITCWQDNILAVEVEGDFDDCQRLVKAAFSDPWWQAHTQLTTANSINIARLLPQMVYYAYTSVHFQAAHSVAPGFVVPSGNLGNVTAAYWAKILGFPIRDIAIATNANRPLTDYLATGEYHALPTQMTLANAMDVGNPSNFARLQNLFPNFAEFKANVQATRVEDPQIKETIKQVYQHEHYLLCPHTATAYVARTHLNDQPWIITATAHPCKFENVIQDAIGIDVAPTAELTALLDRPHDHVTIHADLDALSNVAAAHV